MSLADTSAPANLNAVKSRQVSPLPIGSGGKSATKTQMNQTNNQLTMLSAQAQANTKYDPPPPPPITPAVSIESFCNGGSPALMIVGVLLIVYGFVAK